MYTLKGTNRFVLVFPLLKIVVKFPIISIVNAFQPFFEKGLPRLIKMNYIIRHFKYSKEKHFSFKWCLFRGISDNWLEFIFYCSHFKNPLPLPTYFSFFGFINIQKYDEVCKMESSDFWSQLYRITNRAVDADMHHFSEPRNFTFSEGGLHMNDYGSRRTHGVIIKYGELIVAKFNPDYRAAEDE